MTDIAPLEFWLFLQVGLEALLIGLMVIFLFRFRRSKGLGGRMPEELTATISRFISDSEKISREFTENLKEKKEISLNLLLKLERKINEMNRLLERAEQNLSQAGLTQPGGREPDQNNPAAPENRALVLKLASQGMAVEEIARRTRLFRGEVELILNLEKQVNL